MVRGLRRRFNELWTPELYAQFLRGVDETAGTHVSFRCSETPIFLPQPLLEKMIRYGRELYAQIASNPEYRQMSELAIPPQFRVPHATEHPLFVQADFGFVREGDGSLEPKLVEIQGFPSIYGFQAEMAKLYRDIYDLKKAIDPGLTPFLGGLTDDSYWDLLKRSILNGHAPEQVLLLEIEPYAQKTLADFLVTQRKLGIRIVCITDVTKRGRKLFVDGVEIRRIYNRVIVDELVRKNVQTQFQLTDDLDVEWAGHPNWFFRLSKFSLPWFKHVCVPETWFLSDVSEPPENLNEYVLKPLYSFAGLGVKIGPSKEDLATIPESERRNFVLQRRMEFVPTIDTPSGPTKAEVRIMYVWDGGSLAPVSTVVRTGRGKMMGVDFNKSLDWVGASAGFYVHSAPPVRAGRARDEAGIT